MDGVERLAAVSRILFDTCLFELRRENEALKLRLFWKEHSPDILRGCMCHVNQSLYGPLCSCLACVMAGRHDDDRDSDDEEYPLTCVFKTWFEKVLRDHEMSTLLGVPNVPIWVDGRVVGDHNKVLDTDHHFVHVFSRNGTVSGWVYASKLWKATSVRDPELAKLARLFETLHTF